MDPTKSLSLDGMSALFYQKYGNIMGEKITKVVLAFLNKEGDLEMINHTFIFLISKIKSPQDCTHFRPISLCNVLYKIVSKVLANRLKVILPSIILESQSSFVRNRHIMDNVLIAYELAHALKCRRSGKKGYQAMKLDMSKAYDRVEWPFLLAVMQRIGFSNTWCNMISKYVSSISYSILLNRLPRFLFCKSRSKVRRLAIFLPFCAMCGKPIHSYSERRR